MHRSESIHSPVNLTPPITGKCREVAYARIGAALIEEDGYKGVMQAAVNEIMITRTPPSILTKRQGEDGYPEYFWNVFFMLFKAKYTI